MLALTLLVAAALAPITPAQAAIRSVRAGRGATLLLEWERARIPIPIRPA